MNRVLVMCVVIFSALLGLGAVAYPTVPQFATTTYFTLSTATATASAFWVDYSYLNITCTETSSTACFQQMNPYTYTETWIGTTTEMQRVYSVSETSVPFATSGPIGLTVAALIAVLLLVSIWSLAKLKRGKGNHGESSPA